MDDRYYPQKDGTGTSSAGSSSLTGYNVRSRALGIASRVKTKAVSSYNAATAAAASAAASASSSSAPGPIDGTVRTPDATAASWSPSLARIATGAKVKAISALERAAGALSDGIDREHERRRPSTLVDPLGGDYFDGDGTPSLGNAELRPPLRTRGASRGEVVSAPNSGRSSPLILLRDDTSSRSALASLGIPSSARSSATPSLALSRGGGSRSASPIAIITGDAQGTLDAQGSRRPASQLGRELTIRTYSTGRMRTMDNMTQNRSGRRPYSSLVPVAPGMPLHAPGSEEAVLLPGWAVRRRSKTSSAAEEGEGEDIQVLLAGVVLRTPETPSRSQRIFLRVAKQIAALPKLQSGSMSLSDGSRRTRLPIVVPNFSGAPLSDEPAQVDDLSAYAAAAASTASASASTNVLGSSSDTMASTSFSSDSVALRDGMTSPVSSAAKSSTASSAAPSGPSSPSLEADDRPPLTDRIIGRLVDGVDDDLLLRAMERIGALPAEERPPELAESELEQAGNKLDTNHDPSRGPESGAQSPSVLGLEAARSAHLANAASHSHTDALTDPIPPLTLEPAAMGEAETTLRTASGARSAASSPSKIRRLFSSGLSVGGGGGDSPKLRASTVPGTPTGGNSGASTPITLPRSESASRLSRFAESVKRRASTGLADSASSLSSSVSSLSSSADTSRSPRLSATLPPSSTQGTTNAGPPLSWPSGSGVWADRTFEQLLTLQQNLDARLRAFWTFRVPDREVWIELIPVFEGEEERDVRIGPAPATAAPGMASLSSSFSSSSSSVEDPEREGRTTYIRPLLAATRTRSNATGQFNERFVIPWSKLDHYCRTFYPGQGDKRPERIIALKKRCTLLPADLGASENGAEPGRWIAVDVDVEQATQPAVRVISDVDDTVKRSDVTQGVRKIFHNVFVKPYGEVHIDGVAEWYRTLRRRAQVAFHFVSNTPLELHGLVGGFLEHAGFPRAHLHLKHYPTGTRNLLSSWLEPAGERKRSAVLAILDDFPRARFVLIGDSGELDMELYTAIAAERPKQIIAIFIRNVSSAMRAEVALQVGNAAVASGAGLSSAAGSGSGQGGSSRPLFKRSATLAAMPTAAIAETSYPPTPIDDIPARDYLSTNGGGGGGNGGFSTGAPADESRRKREAAFALRVQRARAVLPSHIPLLFYTEGDQATVDISLDLIEKARRQDRDAS